MRRRSLDLLHGLIRDLDREGLQEAVEAALSPGLVEVLPGAPRRYRFTHVLIQQTLRDELTARERGVLHAQIVDALEQLYGDEVKAHAVELAHHLAETAASDPGRLVKYCRLAGEQALAVNAYDDAAAHFERALAAKQAGPLDDETAAILVGLGKAQAALLPTVRMREAVATLGLLARTFGDNDLARRHFEDALSYCEPRGLRLERAWTAYDFAELLVDSPDHNDQLRGADLLDQAIAISEELGLRPLHERSIALAQRLAPRAAARPSHPDGLTVREVEVIRLLAAGKTDRAIAELLSISVRTAGNHVANILGKTNSANRTEAATYALRHGLI
ncbi:MAG: LuxR C-terminal-related transcriptional regulator [Dehalococcoidia bacterium]